MAKKVTVLTFRSDTLEENDDLLTGTQETLRALRGLGVRFATEIVDGAETTVVAWLDTPEPKEKKVRQALGGERSPTDAAGIDPRAL